MTVESEALPGALDPLGVLVVRLGPDGTVVACNDNVSEILGLPTSAIVGRHHQALFGSLDVPRTCVVERIMFHPDGESCKIRWSINPQFDPSGMPNGMSCLGVEVTKSTPSMAVEEPVTRRSSGGSFVIDGNGRIERVHRSGAKTFGIDEDMPKSAASVDPSPDRFRRFNSDELGPYAERHPEVPQRGVVELAVSTTEFPLTLHVEDRKPTSDRRSLGFSSEEVLGELDASHRKQARHLGALKEVLRVTGANTPAELARGVLPRIAEFVWAQAAAVIIEADGQSFVEFFGLPPETTGMVMELLSCGEFDPVALQALTRMFVVASLPLDGAHGKFGQVLLFSRQEIELDAERTETLDTLIRSFAVALENLVVTRQIETVKASRDSAHESILRAMVAALELRDQETEGHTQRVTRISLQLGESLGLRGLELRNLEHGALLHDVGKIGIPDAILHKPGPLSTAEWEIMRKHPQYAYDILSPLPHLAHALDVPYCHHERYDGSGYPRGLEGADIPLAARIFAVVDVFDAMTTERPYRPALPEEYAIAHLRSHSGTHFDPVVVAAFTTLVDKVASAEAVQE